MDPLPVGYPSGETAVIIHLSARSLRPGNQPRPLPCTSGAPDPNCPTGQQAGLRASVAPETAQLDRCFLVETNSGPTSSPVYGPRPAALIPGTGAHVWAEGCGDTPRTSRPASPAAGAASRPPGPGLRSGPPARPLASGGGAGRRQGLQCPVQGAGQRYRAVQPGQAEQLPGPGPGADYLQAGPVRGGTPGRADQRREPGRINEADLVKVDDQRAAAGGQLERRSRSRVTVAMSTSPATATIA
jgi:hypothetical protein